ncbi:uncharacterized protein LOC8268412 [Ricinus communis]|uniref:Dnajc14 protein, putative n=1 Tax=Ricinus communis TaxID=3988 RepID=B9RJW9_RICCO|nr:uncharacterized protein LOC8268412 [Ricinus communis]EEF48621.1 dnajc14 protein, putative [Ricinus communis]|eukprot:XP_002514038.1 uncharacterized protein LOC8268412 [Ricinus communis]
MNENPNRAEAERLLGIAEKLLQSRDFNGTRDFAVLAQETEPLLDGSDQILAVADVLLSSDKRINNHHDWYSILQIDRRSDDQDLIKKQYRRLALLLHPDKNKFPFADQAFKLVADAWTVLSDSSKKSLYDNELSLFSRVDLSNSAKLPVRRSQRPAAARKHTEERVQTNYNSISQDRNQKMKLSSFWTACPYCLILYEYPRVYHDCCLRCQNCQRAFHAALVPSLPPLVPGKEAYYCCWGFFPLGFMFDGEKNTAGSGSGQAGVFPNWMPPIFGSGQQVGDKNGGGTPQTPVFADKISNVNTSGGAAPSRTVVAPAAAVAATSPAAAANVRAAVGRGGGVVGNGTGFAPKKRGRPRKYPLPGQSI